MASEQHTLTKGSVVGHYTVIDTLGVGGMGEVVLALDNRLGRKVALKLLRADRTRSHEALERFLFEARATARFNHPHIVTVYDVGEHDGRPYLALEYLQGQTLRERLSRERLSERESIRIGLAIAQALAAAHAECILHRDLKPDNVMVGRDGAIRVLDFGLALLLGGEEASDREADSTTGVFVSKARGRRGTAMYMSPEQWQDRPIGAETDVWALGLVLYEMLAGRHAFVEAGSERELCGLVTSTDPVPSLYRHGHFSHALTELVDRCLSKDRAARPAAAVVVQELERLLTAREPTNESRCPFRGLQPFDEEHRQLFFGRAEEVESFLERLREQTVMLVVGPSGAGKSSFIKAGVIPRLREKGPLVLIHLRPGREPFANLAGRLAFELGKSDSASLGSFGSLTLVGDGLSLPHQAIQEQSTALARELRAEPWKLGSHLQRLAANHRAQVVLFVDQLEELCTQEDPELAGQFMLALAKAADDCSLPIRVLLTMREEFLSRLLSENPVVQAAMNRITVLSHPSAESLWKIFSQTAEAAGYRFEDPFLVRDMVAEVRREAACLPLLQFAAQRLWEDRDEQNRVLRRSAYNQMRGVAGALAGHADGELRGLSDRELSEAKTIFLRLVTEDNTRRIVKQADLLAGLGPEAGRVLERLVAARLIVARKRGDEGGGEYELVHESLITGWARLAGWIDESREERRQLRQIELAAEYWDRRGRRAGDVLGDEALAELSLRENMLPDKVREFLEASRVGRRQRKQRQGLRTAAVFALVASAFAIGVWLASRPAAGICDGAGPMLAGVWNAEVRERLQGAFLGTGRPYAADMFTRLAARLDAWEKSFASKHAAICQATEVDHTQPEAIMGLRLGCLQRQLSKVRAQIEVLGEKPSAEGLDRSIQAFAEVESLEECDDLEALQSVVELPESQYVRNRVNEIRQQLYRADALLKAGRYSEGLAIAEGLQKASEETGHRPVQAEVLLQLAKLQEASGHYKEAVQNLQQAAWLADYARHDEVRANALLHLAAVLGTRLAQFGEALSALRAAEAAVGRLPVAALMQARWNKINGVLALAQGEYRNALQFFARARRSLPDKLGPGHPELASIVSNTGLAYARLAEYSQALENFEWALEDTRKAFGADHPSVASLLSNIGNIQLLLGEIDRAIESQQTALRIAERSLGEDNLMAATIHNALSFAFERKGDQDKAIAHGERALLLRERSMGANHPLVATVLSSLGALYLARHEYDRALASGERALSIREQVLGPDHPDMAFSLVLVGEVYIQLGRFAEAEKALLRALRISEKANPPKHPSLSFPLAYLGKVYMRTERPHLARECFDKVLSLCAESACEPEPLATAQFGLSQLLWQQRRTQAVELAEKARAGFRRINVAEAAAEVDHWLRERRFRP